MKALAILSALLLVFVQVSCTNIQDSNPLNPLTIEEVHGPAHGTFGPFGSSVPYRPDTRPLHVYVPTYGEDGEWSFQPVND